VQLKRQSTVFTLAAEAELPFALLRTINQAEELDIVKEVGVGAFGTVRPVFFFFFFFCPSPTVAAGVAGAARECQDGSGAQGARAQPQSCRAGAIR